VGLPAPTGVCFRACVRFVLASLLVTLSLAGCAHRGAPALPIVLGPYAFEQGTALLNAVRVEMHAAGYTPTNDGSVGGHLEARAHTRVRGEEPALLVVQLYREGWVACEARVPDAAGRRGARIEAEAEALALVLQRALERRGFVTRGAP